MEEIRRCTRCIIPEVLPSVKFGKDSVCNYCKEYDNLFSNWSNTQLQRKQEFEDILQRAKRLKLSPKRRRKAHEFIHGDIRRLARSGDK